MLGTNTALRQEGQGGVQGLQVMPSMLGVEEGSVRPPQVKALRDLTASRNA